MTNTPTTPTSRYSARIEQVLASMSLKQRIGQVLHPVIVPREGESGTAKRLAGIEPGGISLASCTRAESIACTDFVQSRAMVPVLVGTDLENGPGRIIKDATQFPDAMGLAATGNERYAYEMGRSAALEGRACGVHWSFSPVVDINANPYNPITNTRSLGDDPDTIARLSVQLIRGMQENGLAACAKHFPGDGFDDRDQHICTTINPLRLDDWFRLSGRMFQTAIDAGVWTIMIGHIALPAFDPGAGRSIADAPPATLSRRLVTDLLRNTLGFDGLVVTDALGMGGVTTRAEREQLILGAFEAGADLLLFAEMAQDYAILARALEDGRLSMTRIEESIRRILHVKEMLGLLDDRASRPVSEGNLRSFAQTAQAVAEEMLTVVVDEKRILPLNLKAGDKVFCFHVRGDAEYNADGIDDLLRSRGIEVTRCQEGLGFGEFPSEAELRTFDAVLVHLVFGPTWGAGRIRPNGNYMRDLATLYGMHLPRLLTISYGSPYMHYEFPHLPALLNAYSPDPTTQAAILRFLLGEIDAPGSSPVNLDSPYLFKYGAALSSAR